MFAYSGKNESQPSANAKEDKVDIHGDWIYSMIKCWLYLPTLTLFFIFIIYSFCVLFASYFMRIMLTFFSIDNWLTLSFFFWK